MYPDNYMNPMNNPMTNPNYGYNRMQQVQQMQRAINPQVPNMFGQVEQPQQMQSFISAVPVTCLEEAKAARIALDGSIRGEYASSADSNRNYCLSGLYPHR